MNDALKHGDVILNILCLGDKRWADWRTSAFLALGLRMLADVFTVEGELFVATEMDFISRQKCFVTTCVLAVLYRMLTRGQRGAGLSIYLWPRGSILTHVRSGRSATRSG